MNENTEINTDVTEVVVPEETGTEVFPTEGNFDQDEKGNDLLGAVIIGAIGFVGGVVVDKITTTIKNKKAEKADGADPKEKVGLIDKIKGTFKKDKKETDSKDEPKDESDVKDK